MFTKSNETSHNKDAQKRRETVLAFLKESSPLVEYSGETLIRVRQDLRSFINMLITHDDALAPIEAFWLRRKIDACLERMNGNSQLNLPLKARGE